MIYKFYKRNKKLLSFNMLVVFSIFVVNIIINTILLKEYNFSEIILSYSNVSLSIGILLGTFVVRYFLSFKVNYFKILSNSLLILIIIKIVYIIYIPYNNIILDTYGKNISNMYQLLYLFFRFLEGFITNLVFFTLFYILSYKLLNNKSKSLLNSLIYSKVNLIKFISPIFAAWIISYTNNNLIIYFISILFLLISLILLLYNQKQNLRDIHRYIVKKHKIKKKKLKYVSLKNIFNFDFFKIIKNIGISKHEKIFININIFNNNQYRSFNDFYFIIIITNIFNLTIIQGGFVFSMIILIQSLSFKISFLFDYLERKYTFSKIKETITIINNIFTFIILFVFVYIYYLYKVQNVYLLSNIYTILIIYALMWGLSRSIYNDLYYRVLFDLSGKYKNLENFKTYGSFLTEISHLLGYLIAGVLFYFYSYYGVLFFYLFISIIDLITNTILKKFKKI